MEKPSSHGPPETFVKTDASNFKELVQRLTGPGTPSVTASSPKVPVIKRPKRQGLRPKLTITKPNSSSFHSMGMGIVSPSSPNDYLRTSPLISPSSVFLGLRLSDDESSSTTNSSSGLDEEAEEKAIKEKRFYLHPSPRDLSPRIIQPELLPLFPLSSPKTV